MLLARWANLDAGWRAGVVAIAATLVLVPLLLTLRRMRGRGGWGSWIVAYFAAVGFVSLGYWAGQLPAKDGMFVLWHQYVRVGAATCAMFGAIVGLSLCVGPTLNLMERAGFTSSMAARLFRARKSGFLKVISTLSVAGVGLSTAAICIVISIMGGFGADLKRKILDNNAHVRIDAGGAEGIANWRPILEELSRLPGVTGATPVVGGEVMASSPTNTAGVILRGIDPVTVPKVLAMPRNLEVGDFSYLTKPQLLADLPEGTVVGLGPGGERYLVGPKRPPLPGAVPAATSVFPGIILGRELADTLHVQLGEEMSLVSPIGELGPMGIMPRSKRFRVAGIFYSGMYEYDASHAYVTLDMASAFLDKGELVTALELRLDDPDQPESVRDAARAIVLKHTAGQTVFVRDWMELNRQLFSALKLERWGALLILSFIMVVASFSIVCTLLLMVDEKSRQIAIMKACGASDREILIIFAKLGAIIGAIGTAFGVSVAYAATKSLQELGTRLDPEVYYITKLPIQVNGLDYGMVAIGALVITILAGLRPARLAAALRPVEGIRHD